MEEKFLKIMKEKCLSGELMEVKVNKFSVNFENNRLKNIEEGETSGVAVRLKKNNKLGFSYSTDSEDIVGTVERAYENANVSPEVNFDFAGPVNIPAPICFDKDIVNLDRKEIIDTGKENIDFLRSLREGVQGFFSMSKHIISKKILTTEGFSCNYNKSILLSQIGGVYAEEGNILWVFGEMGRTSKHLLDIGILREKIKKNFEDAEKNVKIERGRYPVIFTPFSAVYLLLPFQFALNARNVIKGTSILKDKLNKQTFSNNLTIINDPLLSYGIATTPFDDEGIPSERKALILQGRPVNYLTDLFSANKLNLKPGNASRDLSTPPAPSFANIAIEHGNLTLQDILKVKNGIIIESLMGVQMGNVNGGEVTGNIELGYLVENGEIRGRVKDAMISLNIMDALKDILVSQETIWTDYLLSPYILIPDVSIATKS